VTDDHRGGHFYSTIIIIIIIINTVITFSMLVAFSILVSILYHIVITFGNGGLHTVTNKQFISQSYGSEL
jgi:hypothetical protein